MAAGAPRLVIVGGGFGGLFAARNLRGAAVRITLVDKRNFHLFQPLLYQVATGGLSPANIAAPLRTILARQRNVRVLLGEVVGFSPADRRVLLHAGDELDYDHLIVAAGSVNHYFGHDAWSKRAPGLKTLEDAVDIRGKVLLAFENAEREDDPARAREWLSFVVVGAGPTGVELAGTLGEIARYTLRHEFRAIDPARANIHLIEGSGCVLPGFAPELSRAAHRSLHRLGVQVHAATKVVRISPKGVRVESAAGARRIPARTVLWAAGVRGSPLGAVLAEATGAELDGAGRIRVGPELSLPGHPGVYVIGDLAHCPGADGEPLPGLAPVAMQQGRYVARRILGESAGPFRYADQGVMTTIGRTAAVADLKGKRFTGYVAWLIWLFVHLVQIVQFERRLLVLVQWAWNYFTFSRTARLITNSRRGRR